MASCIVLAWLAVAPAQDPPASSRLAPQDKLSEILPPGLRPDVMVLRDEQGKEILVPRTRYEEYERRLVEQEDPSSEPPLPAGLSSLDIVVEPEKEYARVAVKASTSLGRATKTWQTIPIALGQLQWVPRTSPDTESAPPLATNPLEEIAVAPQSNGYLWRVRPGKETARSLELSAVCKLTSSSGGYAVRFDLPPAATVIRLKLPAGDWELTATGGGNEVVEPFQRVDAHSVAIVRTTASTVTLSWNRKTEKDAVAAVEVTSQTKFSPTSDASVFRAVTSLAFRGPRKLGGKRFKLVLPSGSVLREAAAPTIGFPAYRLSRASTDELETEVPTDPQAPVEWNVEFEESLTRSEIEIPIEWQWTIPTNQEKQAFLVPNIDGAQRHTGTFECLVPRNVLFEWEPVGTARLLRQSQSNDGSDSMSYSFQFDRSGAGVRGSWTSLASRPRLFSKQTIEVKDQLLQMTGSIEFLSDPIQLPLLQFEAAGWRVDRLVMRPTDVEIETTAVARNNDASSGVSIPINSSLWISNPAERAATSADAPRAEGNASNGLATATTASNANDPTADSTTKIRLDFVLSQPLNSDQVDIAFALPKLSWLAQDSQQRIAKTIPGTLTVYSWPFRLQEPAALPEGWIPAPASDRIAQFRAGTDAFSPFLLAYQILESSTQAAWNGSRIRRPSSTATNYRASASVERDAISIQHQWSCVSYGNRPQELRLGIPKEWLGPDSADGETDVIASLRVDGQTAPYEWVDADSQSETTAPTEPLGSEPNDLAQVAVANDRPSAELRWVRFPIPNFANDGLYRTRFSIELTTRTPLDWNEQAWVALDQSLPILSADQPADVLVCDSATLTAAVGRGVILDPVDMQLAPSDDRTGSTGNALAATRAWTLDPDAPHWSSRVLSSTASLQPLIMVEAEWIQTILNAIYQRDRYVVRFASDAEFVDLELSPALRKDAEWLLNGQRANVAELPDAPDRVRVLLKDAAIANNIAAGNAVLATKSHVLEVFTLRPAQGGWLKRIGLQPPRLIDASNACPLIWQIIVPRTEHLISSSDQLSPLYRWKWRDLFLVRASEYSQIQMEQSLGATHQAEVTLQTNQYDLSSMNANASLETWFVPSSLIWFPIAMTVLVLAILMTEKHWLRWPWAWVLLLCMALLFSQWAWDISVIAAQAALAAILIAILYGLLRWLLDRRARRRSIFVSRSTSLTAANASRASAGSGSHLASPESNSKSHPSGPALPAASGDSE